MVNVAVITLLRRAAATSGSDSISLYQRRLKSLMFRCGGTDT